MTTLAAPERPAPAAAGDRNPIVVTGATGFLGRRVAASLAFDGHAMRCLLRGSSDAGPLEQAVGGRVDLSLVRLDFRDQDALTEAMRGADTLLHLAAGLSGSTSALFASGPVATRKLLHAAADAGIGRVVLISSLGVYGASLLRSGQTLDESTPIDPNAAARDPYSYSKVRQEEVARRVAEERGLDLVVIRPGVIFGEGRPTISSRAGLPLGGLLVQMGGRQLMPYTYVENCADAVAAAATAPTAAGQTINILDDDLPTASGLVRTVRQMGKPVRRLWVPGPLVPTACAVYHWYSRVSGGQLPPVLTRYRAKSMWKPVAYSNAKAKRVLGWAPRVSMTEAIGRTVAAELGQDSPRPGDPKSGDPKSGDPGAGPVSPGRSTSQSPHSAPAT